MKNLIEKLISTRDAKGYPQPRLLVDVSVSSLPVAEHVDLYELEMLMHAPAKEFLVKTIGYDPVTLTPMAAPSFEGRFLSPSSVIEHIVEYMYADNYVELDDGFALWQPGSEDWYVLFAETSKAKNVIESMRDSANKRFSEWAEEPFQSEKSRAAALQVFHLYNL